MTDIPVGSPPVPPGRHAAPGGWYSDPLDPGKERYWDGWQWSRNTRGVDAPPSSAQPGPAQPYGQPYPGATGQPPSGQYPSGPYAQHPDAQQPYPQQPYPQQPYPQDPYAQPSPPYPYQQGQPYPQPPQGYYASAVPGGGKATATADGVPLASWWWRVLAVLIDSVIVSAIAALPSFGIYARLFDQLSAVLKAAMQAAQTGQPAPVIPSGAALISGSDRLLLTLISVSVALAYHAAFVRWKAATPGKLLCGLRIVPTDQGRTAGPLPWNTVLIRVAIWVLPGIYGLLVLFKLLDALFPLWQPKRQAIHDLAAHTQVVRLR